MLNRNVTPPRDEPQAVRLPPMPLAWSAVLLGR